MSNQFDAIIIGGGHNGLVTAAYLARAGWRVTVLERRHVVGGAAVTEETWPGYRVSSLSYLCSLLQPRIIQELELARFGYHIYPKDPSFFHGLPRRTASVLLSGHAQDPGRAGEVLKARR